MDAEVTVRLQKKNEYTYFVKNDKREARHPFVAQPFKIGY